MGRAKTNLRERERGGEGKEGERESALHILALLSKSITVTQMEYYFQIWMTSREEGHHKCIMRVMKPTNCLVHPCCNLNLTLKEEQK